MIKEKKSYPITYLKSLKKTMKEKMVSANIILLKDLINKNPKELERKLRASEIYIYSLIEKAKVILEES
jgi:hypothetical protein